MLPSRASLLRDLVHAFRLETAGSLEQPPATGWLLERTRQRTNARRHRGSTRRGAVLPELRRRVSPRRGKPPRSADPTLAKMGERKFSSLQTIEKARNAKIIRTDEGGLGAPCEERNHSWRAGPFGASSPTNGRRDLYPRATRCALASQSRWLWRTCAGARRRSRTTSSAITWASAARPRRCSSCA
jgi:hypothetical protein